MSFERFPGAWRLALLLADAESVSRRIVILFDMSFVSTMRFLRKSASMTAEQSA